MTNEEYRRLEGIARDEADNEYEVSLADRDHSDRKYHFKFVDPDRANAFEYRARVLGFSTSLDIHGNVWVGDKD